MLNPNFAILDVDIVHKNIYIYTSLKKVREIYLDLKIQFDYYARHVEWRRSWPLVQVGTVCQSYIE
jgi:hypothetical protein